MQPLKEGVTGEKVPQATSHISSSWTPTEGRGEGISGLRLEPAVANWLLRKRQVRWGSKAPAHRSCVFSQDK